MNLTKSLIGIYYSIFYNTEKQTHKNRFELGVCVDRRYIKILQRFTVTASPPGQEIELGPRLLLTMSISILFNICTISVFVYHTYDSKCILKISSF